MARGWWLMVVLACGCGDDAKPRNATGPPAKPAATRTSAASASYDAGASMRGSPEIELWAGKLDDLQRLVYTTKRRKTIIERRPAGAGNPLWAVAVDANGKRREYPVGSHGARLLKPLLRVRATKLGRRSAARLAEYGMSNNPATLELQLAARTHTLRLGELLYDRHRRYAQLANGDVVVVPLTHRVSALRLKVRRPLSAKLRDVQTVTLEAGTDVVRLTADRRRTALLSRDGRPDHTMSNLVRRIFRLAPISFHPGLRAAELVTIVRLGLTAKTGAEQLVLYRDDRGKQPAYYVQSANTRVLARVPPRAAARVASDVKDLL